ncbi:DNA replication/repair protein RecF [Leucobacter sp. UT-8R-CII-1-4]|uniref:DNA replication/repair protein RecF n=1 Tax=Leucobacter sp. UT-8R-CII-1-4 TaxID=3040075 RepID=UPI0024A88CB8|nr:DNA replication/repair protein RecF [Leucobacter sp. UT-8R-CII-1-4]MDI6023463.1 DNA replication/repair protein RecF [Leucobacter sp. UT-8R-CII-1-4]
MRVTHLSLSDFRNYRSAEVGFAPGPNLVIGRNGQGKTNLVEAISYFASLNSHRVSSDSALIRAGENSAVARMKVAVGERDVLLEMQLNRDKANRAQVNRNAVKPRELTRWFSCVLFAPEDLSLVRGDPGIRRKFLDEAVIARNPVFAGVLSDYERVVRQRTTLLKSSRHGGSRGTIEATLDLWDTQLVELGSRIMLERRELLASLQSPLRAGYEAIVQYDHRPEMELIESVFQTVAKHGVSRETLNPETVSEIAREQRFSDEANAQERPGYSDPTELSNPSPRENAFSGNLNAQDGGFSENSSEKDPLTSPRSILSPEGEGSSALNSHVSRETLEENFRNALSLVRRQEFDRGMTLIGPHRDELLLKLNDLPVKGYASHGESWSFALSLRLAVATLLREELPSGDPVIILDDVFAELDVRRRNALMAEVARFEQVIVTAAVEEDVPEGDWHRVRISGGTVIENGESDG